MTVSVDEDDTEKKKNKKKKAVYTTACGWEGAVMQFGCLFCKNFNSELDVWTNQETDRWTDRLTYSHTGNSKPTDRQTD